MFQNLSRRSIEIGGFETRLKFIKFGLCLFNLFISFISSQLKFTWINWRGLNTTQREQMPNEL